MRIRRPLLPAVVISCLLAGCAQGPQPACNAGPADRISDMDRDHSVRVAAAQEDSVQARTPDDKGPSAEGVEAIALLGKQMLDNRRDACVSQKSSP
jgi:hypothetical protein